MNRRRLLPGILLAALCFIAAFRPGIAQSGSEADSSWRKPLFSANQFPIYLLFLRLEPERAVSLAAGQASFKFDLNVSNIIKTSILLPTDINADRLVLDYEWWRFLAQLDVGLGRGLQMSMSLPLYDRSGGFLDPLISGFHETFGFPNAVRAMTPDNLFRYELWHDGRRVLGPFEPGTVTGDLVVSLKKAWMLGGTEFGVRAVLKVPTGLWVQAAGSGAADLGFGFLLSRYGERLGFCLNADYCFLGQPEDRGLRSRDYFSGMASLDLVLGRALDLVVQADYCDRLVESLIPILNRRTGQITAGLRGRLSRRCVLEFRFTEDLAATSPDFTFGLCLEYRAR
jgi:hypothetical protein